MGNEMKTLTIGGRTYYPGDAAARTQLEDLSASGLPWAVQAAIYNLLMDAVYQSSGHEADKAALAGLLTDDGECFCRGHGGADRPEK